MVLEIVWRLLSPVQWSLCLLSLLLPIVSMICAIRSKSRKTSRLSLAEMGPISGERPPDSIEVTTSELRKNIIGPASSKRKSTQSQREHRGSFPGQDTPRSVKKALRQLPPLPELEKSSVRRHSSYTGSVVYDVVATEVCNPWLTTDNKASQQQTADGSNHLEEVDEKGEVPFPVYATVNKTKVCSNSSRRSPLYAKVNKTSPRTVKS
ncbi:uncharacterized protein LOC115176360 isoform X1 [Salmo trutta]|uniref:uncharacterized protein LOC115176360 isoform X1 n=2 Tax=Salmo trutta TaxID=8032 RepID=UPI0011313415|nr:uncharacterized protein LOC115176360 isoform X1 [Salmo trutta]XP_029592188.1 uncharacterized protein LOC115176360 isoform X1 [Salmo trutta]XP_029592198.1 uncharacterized protein LOC115176360 isoform X1 [Salmo trutta]